MSFCKDCNAGLAPGKFFCARCGGFTTSETGNISSVSEQRTTTLDQVEAAALDRVLTGGPWDEVWGGGFVPGALTLTGGSAGMGKMLSVDTPIRLADRWSTMGEIVVGDVAYDEEGRPAKVLACTEIAHDRPCYRLSFFGFGGKDEIVADAEHLWTITAGDGRGSRTVTTKEIADTFKRLKYFTVRSHAETSWGVHGRWWSISSIKPEPSVPMRCIAVDSPSHLYLAGRGMIPTHNTTMLLQMASAFAHLSGKKAYFLSAEQAPGEIRLTADRLLIPNLEKFRVMKEFGAGADIDKDLLKKDPPSCLVVDSVSALCGKDVHAAIIVSRNMKKLAVEFKVPAFLICHMNKQGDFAGLYTLQHDVDTIVTVFGPESDRVGHALARAGHTEETIEGLRVLTSWKNRFGPTGKDHVLTMTAHGIMPLPTLPEKADKKKKKTQVQVPALIEAPVVVVAAPVIPAPETISVAGQKLVRKPKKKVIELEPARARAVGGEALKKPRAPMPKVVPRKGASKVILKKKKKVLA